MANDSTTRLVYIVNDGYYLPARFEITSSVYNISKLAEKTFKRSSSSSAESQTIMDLQIGNRKLKLFQDLNQNRINSHDVIEAVEQHAFYFPIHVQYDGLPPVTVNVHNKTLIKHIKTVALLRLKLPVTEKDKLYHERRYLQDYWTISSANLKPGAVLKINQGRLFIYLSTINESVPYLANINSTWKAICRRWAQTCCVTDPDDIIFKLNGRTLDMNQTVAASNCEENATIQVVFPSYYVNLRLHLNFILYSVAVNPNIKFKKLLQWMTAEAKTDLNGYVGIHNGAILSDNQVLRDVGIVANSVIIFMPVPMAA